MTIHELTEVDGEIYIIMELLDGVDLAALIARPTELPLVAKLTIVDQVLDGLHYAHEQGVVHRDIKPGNLHLTGAGVAKILDFGIARLLTTAQLTGTRGIVGTPAYMSPEQAMGQPVDRRTDLFAVGAVLYELICGLRPFQSDSIGRLMAMIVEAPHDPLGPDVPDAVARLVDRLLSKDPAGRPQTAAAAREELGRALETVADSSDRDAMLDISAGVRETITARETMAPDAVLPPTPRAPTPRAPTPAEHGRPTSAAGLTTFALEQGKTLRQQGDLGGAMRALRSVLEADPGNEEALTELQRVEQELSGSGPGSGAGMPSRQRTRLVGAAALLIGAAGVGVWWALGTEGGTEDLPDSQVALVSSPSPPAMPVAEQAAEEPDVDSTVPASTDAPAGVAAAALAAQPGASSGSRPPSPASETPPVQPPGDIADPPVPGPGRLPPAGRGGGPRFGRGRGGIPPAGPETLGRRGPPRGADPGPAEPGLRRAIDEYVSGLERRDTAAVRQVRPTLSAFEQRLIDAAEPARVRFEGLQVQMQAGADDATVLATRVVERRDVQPRRREDRVRLTLVRTGDGWQITDLRPVLQPR